MYNMNFRIGKYVIDDVINLFNLKNKLSAMSKLVESGYWVINEIKNDRVILSCKKDGTEVRRLDVGK